MPQGHQRAEKTAEGLCLRQPLKTVPARQALTPGSYASRGSCLGSAGLETEGKAGVSAFLRFNPNFLLVAFTFMMEPNSCQYDSILQDEVDKIKMS